jgi:glutaredoxin
VTALVTVHLRAGCHLCDDALAALAPLRSERRIEIETVDIESDERLHARYLERIPVISLDGVELYDFFVDLVDLERRLRAVESPGA